jgi:hypothetical protein
VVVLNACVSIGALEEACMVMSRSFKEGLNEMSSWLTTSLICMPNVALWRRLGELSTRFHHEMWSLGMLQHSTFSRICRYGVCSFITLRTLFVLVGIIGDASGSVFSMWLDWFFSCVS